MEEGPTSTKKSHQPPYNRFTQQELPACRPLLTPAWVVSIFFIIGIIFVPIGAVCLTAAFSVEELVQRYDALCATGATTSDKDQALLVAGENGTQCQVSLTLTSDMAAPVYVYYELTNFYQNHRRYVKSRDDAQLRGEARVGSQMAACDPERYLGGDTSKLIDPCGLVAWSNFNDTFQITPAGAVSPLAISSQGIAWGTDTEHKFSKTAKPQNFNTQPDLRGGLTLDPAVPFSQDERFIVWMRTAATPNFRKLWGRIDQDLPANTVLNVSIANRYNSYRYGGEKRVVVSTASWLGGRNSFMGTAYLVVGGASLLFALAFLALQSAFPRPLGDESRLSWSTLHAPARSSGLGSAIIS